MLIPIYTDRRLAHRPAVNLGLIGLNVLVFLLQQASPTVTAALVLRPYDLSPLNVVGSTFLHGGVLHLLGNMLFLYIFGNNVNDRLGNAAYLGFYLAGGVAAGLLHALTDTSQALGASGAVAAVTGAYLVVFPRSQIVVLFLYFVITTFSVPAVWFVGLKIFLDLFMGFNTSVLGAESGVAHFAHLGGYAYGLLAGSLLLRANLIPRDPMDGLSILGRSRRRSLNQRDLRRSGQTHGSALDIVPASQADPKLARVADLRAEINAAFDRDDAATAADRYRDLLSVDPRQSLSHGAQMAVANELYKQGRHREAAAAYRRFLDRFSSRRDAEAAQAELMLGLLLSRYLNEPAAANDHLKSAADRLDALGLSDDAAFARGERAALASPSR